MKCVSCGVDVNPNFTHAILRNECPACGQPLIEKGDFSKIKSLKREISQLDSNISDNSLLAISTFLVGRYDMTLKTGETESPDTGDIHFSTAPPSNKKPPTSIKRSGVVVKSAREAEIEAIINGDDIEEEESTYDEYNLTAEERQSLYNEYFSDQDSGQSLQAQTHILAAAMSDVGPPIDDFVPAQTNDFNIDRLTRGKNLRQSISGQSGMIRRSSR